jgi:hypothetical protein
LSVVDGELVSEPKIIIAGTGRAGTTLLVQILTDLGLDTGFVPHSAINARSRAGLESRVDETSHRIVKDPGLSLHLGRLIEEGQVSIEHVIVPVRDLDIAAASRIRATRYGMEPTARGGLFGTRRATNQKEALALLFYQLFDTITRYDLPHTLLRFPRFAQDWQYTYEKLRFLDPFIERERWEEAIGLRADPDLIHEQPLTRGEQSLAIAGTLYTRGIRRTLERARRTVQRDGSREPNS